MLELGPDGAIGDEMPEHGIRTGDVVLVAGQAAGDAKKREVRELERKGVRGVVVRVGKGAVWVAGDDGEGSGSVEERGLTGRVWVVKLADDVTFRR